MITIFIDESGTLPDQKDKYIVISAVATNKLKEAKNVISKVLASLRQRKIRVKELKFYYSGQRTKRQFLSSLVSANLDIFVLIVDKKKRKVADSPENYSLLVADLINEIQLWYKSKRMSLIIDRHFHLKIDQDNFNKYIRKQITKELKYSIDHIDSQQNYLVNLADMAAGAILWKYTNKDKQFYNLIKGNILIEKLISWPKPKEKVCKKSHLNRCKHPSK